MGWKNVKDHYRIRHMVCVGREGICIGSGYIHDIIVISPDGKVIKRYDDRSNEDLRRYQAELDADPALLRKLVATPDSFSQSVPVYTFEDGRILEKRCEQLGWPHVTHDGCLQYENTYSADRATAVQRARQEAQLHINYRRQSISQKEDEISAAREVIARLEANLSELGTVDSAGAGETVDTSTMSAATIVTRAAASTELLESELPKPRG